MPAASKAGSGSPGNGGRSASNSRRLPECQRLVEADQQPATVSRVVRVVHDATVKASYGAVRLGGKIVGEVVAKAIDDDGDA